MLFNQTRTSHGDKHKKKKSIMGVPNLGVNVKNIAQKTTQGVWNVTDGLGQMALQIGKATTDTFSNVEETLLTGKIFPTRASTTPTPTGGPSRKKSAAALEKTATEIAHLKEALGDNFLFASLSSEQLDSIITVFEKKVAKKDDVIIEQSDVGDYFYVLQSGAVEFQVDGETVGTGKVNYSLQEYCSFGELALLYNAPRAASVVVTSSKAVLFQLDQVNFRHAMKKAYGGDFTEGTSSDDDAKVNLLKKIPELADFENAELRKLLSGMTTCDFTQGEVLFEKGTDLNAFIIITSGKCLATEIELGGSTYEDVVLGPDGGPQGQMAIGWRAMVFGEPLMCKVTATTNGTFWAIDFDTFHKVVGDVSENAIRAQVKKQLSLINVFRDSQLDSSQLFGLVDLMHCRRYNRSRWMMKEGDKVEPAMYFVRKGAVVLHSEKGKTTREVQAGGYFGEQNMLHDQHTDAEDRLVIRSPFGAHVGPKTEIDVLYLEECRKVVNTSLLGLGQSVEISSLETSLKLSDLTRHTLLGAGSFGQVWLASAAPEGGHKKHKGDRRIFALKVQSKHQLIDSGQAGSVVGERNIMACLKSPFIIRLYNTFQDESRVYMVTSLLQGGELASVIPKEGLYESAAKFYAAGILEGLTYMHRRHIIHRDLKPENVLIDNLGYPVLIDLGFAKYVPGKTYTFCGTPMYIAPEVISYKGHDKGCDHWSWAVMVFEMITGDWAFYKKGMDELKLFKRICKGAFELTGDMSKEFKLLMVDMLVPDPVRRLGARHGGWNDIFAAPWFADLDLKKLRRQQLDAPWLPNIKNPLDSSNFEKVKGVEDKMKSKDPKISSSDQQIFKCFGPMI